MVSDNNCGAGVTLESWRCIGMALRSSKQTKTHYERKRGAVDGVDVELARIDGAARLAKEFSVLFVIRISDSV